MTNISRSSWTWVYILDTAIKMVLMMKSIVKLPICGLEGLLN
ncbi:hypothetical protein [Candidatus Enterovibrio escicola]|nr:hypothetical protein [Candidatus Enterovibrio escacola]